MKIRKHYLFDFIYLLLILTLGSCKKVNENLISSVNEKSVNLVPFELAKRVAELFDSTIFFKRNVTQSIARASIMSLESPTKNKKIIKSQIVIKDHDSIPALYLFNYEDNGFLVISADFKHEPIMAYVKNGHIEIGDKIPSGFAIWVRKSIFNIESLRKNLYDNSGRAKRAWEKFLNDNNIELDVSNIKIDNSRNIIGTNGIAPPDPIIPCDQVDAVTIGPLIQYNWGQRCTYNNLCDLGHFYGCNISCGNDRPPTGCVATAMSQVIAFWQYPNNYNYQSMPLNSGNLAVQQLMTDAGISVGMNYGCTESSVTDIPILGIRSEEKIRDAFLNSFGYTNATYSLYGVGSYQDVRSDLDNGRPVILGGYSDSQTIFGIELYPEGTGHDWVCDGYFNIVYHCPQISYLYFHMNWGWDGSYNGWYAYNNWNVVWYNNTNTTYQYFLTFVHNIHP